MSTLQEPAATPNLATAAPVRSRGTFARASRRLLNHRLGLFGLIVLAILAFAALFAPWITPYPPTEIYYHVILTPPSWAHPFGTDELGRDILSRVIYGTRVSLSVVAGAILIAFSIGSVIGMLAGYFGGLMDDVIMRIMDGLLSFPLLILALAIVAVLGPDLMNAMIAIAIVNVPGFARLVRGSVLSIREQEFVQAAQALGVPEWRVMLRHVWPSVTGNVIVYGTLRASAALITESSLAFLGLGAQPPTPTWGYMLTTAMQYWDAWWMSVFPGLSIFVAVLAMNFFGDGMRDALDSRLSD